MKRIVLLALVVACAVVWSGPAYAQKKEADKPAAAKKAAEPKSDQVTQCELARLLVNVLGLARFLPPNPSCQQCFGLLMANGVSPANGWDAEAVVTKADLGRVIVQGMQRTGDVKNPDDPASYIEYLKGIGVPIETIGQATDYVDPLAEPVAPNVLKATTDPLDTAKRFNPIDEMQYGTDMATVARLLSEVEFAPLPPPAAPTVAAPVEEPERRVPPAVLLLITPD